MEWYFNLPQKLKAVVLLLVVMGMILFTSLSIRSAIKGMNHDLASVYQDRLQPAIGLVYLSENMHAKRFLLEASLVSSQPESVKAVRDQLRVYDQSSHRLITQFEKTRLVKAEEKSLQAFKRTLRESTQLEQQIVQLQESGSVPAAMDLFNQQGTVIFQQSMLHLHDLAQIQSTVGQEFVRKSDRLTNEFSSILTLQTALVILIGLVILGILHHSKPGIQSYHLN